MKKNTLKISAFLFLALSAFQANAQQIHTELVDGTVYNLRNVKTNQYLRVTSGPAGTEGSVAEVLTMVDYAEDHHINWTARKSAYIATGETEAIHWNLEAQARGILRMKGTKQTISTSKQGPASDVDKIHQIIYDADAGGFRIHNRTGSQSLTPNDHVDGSLTTVLLADATDNEDVWVFEVSEIEEPTASVNTFGVEAFTISNPINNTLIIKGATSKVSKVNVYSVLGNTVLSKSVNNINGDISLNTSSLSKGLYIIEMTGNNGERFTKKIIKQ